MCLAVPGKVVSLREKGKIAVIGYGKKIVSAYNLIKAKKGDWVLIQQKTVVEKIDSETAENAFNSWKIASKN
ncbi:MAG: HypC/HybG/HupF family hydrogenase formation chaperone [Candidatus Diapherotrites archaeon]